MKTLIKIADLAIVFIVWLMVWIIAFIVILITVAILSIFTAPFFIGLYTVANWLFN